MLKQKKNFIKLKTEKTINFSAIESNYIEFLCCEYSIESIAILLNRSIPDVLAMSESICKRVGVKNTLLLKKAIFHSDFLQILLERIKASESALVACDQHYS